MSRIQGEMDLAHSTHDLLIAQRLTKVEGELTTLAVNVNRLINSGAKDRKFWRWAVGAICLALTGGAAAMPRGDKITANDIAAAIRSVQQEPREPGIVKAWEEFLRSQVK